MPARSRNRVYNRRQISNRPKTSAAGINWELAEFYETDLRDCRKLADDRVQHDERGALSAWALGALGSRQVKPEPNLATIRFRSEPDPPNKKPLKLCHRAVQFMIPILLRRAA